ncbi:tumor necrosis factor receptor superfamily member 4 [Microcaecilia unicolor]|uniref:Tumor necrosis factor receptor superfamily member 4 n=1 Tax=Microcaecilia unicolor TaxID=1415580 RepID=A0A6P7ZXN0_9AMPH|nr:tumor necrosis factor receptor superfamily member 4 [Microcaecilia unicolor]
MADRWLLTLAIALVLLTRTHWALTCTPEQYEYTDGGTDRCCQRCPPGQEMVKRCEGREDTKCKPCASNYFSEKYHYDMCKQCSYCDEELGSRTVKKCTSTSNAVCRCVDGTIPYNDEHTVCRCPKGNQLVNYTSCNPCPEGYFSNNDNEKCKPWTNCRAQGKETQTPGTKVTDATCKRSSTTISAFSVKPTRDRTTVFTSARNVTLGERNISYSTNGSLSPKVPTQWGSSFLFIVELIMLGISGTVILLMIFQNCRKKKMPILQGLQGRKSCRIPVQEEHTTSDSILTKV